jgi:hypothetical protein
LSSQATAKAAAKTIRASLDAFLIMCFSLLSVEVSKSDRSAAGRGV